MPENLDLIIAVGLFLVALVVYFLVRLKIVPLKSIPYIIGSLLALVGVQIFKARRQSALGEEIKTQKKELDERAETLDTMKKDLTVAEVKHVEERHQLDEAEAAHIKAMESLKATDDAERAKIADMSTADLFAKYANRPQQLPRTMRTIGALGVFDPRGTRGSAATSEHRGARRDRLRERAVHDRPAGRHADGDSPEGRARGAREGQ
jgi:hypothetical protein